MAEKKIKKTSKRLTYRECAIYSIIQTVPKLEVWR